MAAPQIASMASHFSTRVIGAAPCPDTSRLTQRRWDSCHPHQAGAHKAPIATYRGAPHGRHEHATGERRAVSGGGTAAQRAAEAERVAARRGCRDGAEPDQARHVGQRASRAASVDRRAPLLGPIASVAAPPAPSAGQPPISPSSPKGCMPIGRRTLAGRSVLIGAVNRVCRGYSSKCLLAPYSRCEPRGSFHLAQSGAPTRSARVICVDLLPPGAVSTLWGEVNRLPAEGLRLSVRTRPAGMVDAAHLTYSQEWHERV